MCHLEQANSDYISDLSVVFPAQVTWKKDTGEEKNKNKKKDKKKKKERQRRRESSTHKDENGLPKEEEGK